MSTILKPGTCVYRVVEDDLPDGEPRHTWKVACVTVEKASDRQVQLSKRFQGLANIRFEPEALGRYFFETPLQAIQAFLTERRLEMETLERKRATATRAIEWAVVQPGVTP